MPRLTEEFLDTLRQRLDIEEFIGGYVALRRRGRLSKGLCPFHSEKTPSFTVYPDTQSFYCFGCGKGGDIITFTREIENLDYLDAVKLLAEKAGLSVPTEDYDDTLSKKRARMLEMNKEAAHFFYACLIGPQGKAGLQYWQNQRHLTPQTIKHFGLGFAPDAWHSLRDHMRNKGYSDQELYEANLVRRSEKNGNINYYDNFRNRAMVPIIDLRGHVIAFGGRVLDDSKPKYVNTSDTLVYKKSQALFALNFAKSAGKDSLILCEGYMDVIALHQAGFTNAVAGLGTALTDEQVRLLSRYCKEVILSYDNDEAGRAATEKALEKFDRTGLSIRSLQLAGGKDPDEILQKFGAERFQSILDGAANETEYRLFEKRKKYNLGTDDGRVQYLREAVPILAKLDSPVEQDIYASRLSEDLGVSKEAILLQIKDVTRKQKRKAERVDFGALRHEFDRYPAAQGQTGTVSLKTVKAEETIVSLLLNNPDFYRSVQQDLSPEDFPTAFYRKAYEVIRERISSGRPLDLIYLSSDFSPEEMSKLAGLQTDSVLVSNTQEELRDCIGVLKAGRGKEAPVDPATLSDDAFRDLFKNHG